MKEGLMGFLMIILVIGGLFGLTALSLAHYQFFAPRFENARREVFENTKSFRDGSRRDFDNLYVAYQSAKTPEEKQAILSVIRQRVYGVPEDQVPSEINQLLTKGQ